MTNADFILRHLRPQKNRPCVPERSQLNVSEGVCAGEQRGRLCWQGRNVSKSCRCVQWCVQSMFMIVRVLVFVVGGAHGECPRIERIVENEHRQVEPGQYFPPWLSRTTALNDLTYRSEMERGDQLPMAKRRCCRQSGTGRNGSPTAASPMPATTMWNVLPLVHQPILSNTVLPTTPPPSPTPHGQHSPQVIPPSWVAHQPVAYHHVVRAWR